MKKHQPETNLAHIKLQAEKMFIAAKLELRWSKRTLIIALQEQKIARKNREIAEQLIQKFFASELSVETYIASLQNKYTPKFLEGIKNILLILTKNIEPKK